MFDLGNILYGQGAPAPTPQTAPQGVPVQPPPELGQGVGIPPGVPAAQSASDLPPNLPRIDATPEQENLANQQAQKGGFFDRLRTDPALSQAMLMFGARLAQGPKPGQSMVGAFGEASLAAGLTHQMVQTNMRELETKEAESLSRRKMNEAYTSATTSREARENAAAPGELARVQADTKRLLAQGRKEEAMARIEELKSDPKWAGKVMQAELNKLEAAANASMGTAAAGFANARESDAKAGLAVAQKNNPEKFAKAGSEAAAVQTMKYLEESYATIYPDMPPADRKRKAVEEARKQARITAAITAGQNIFDMSTQEGIDKAVQMYNRFEAGLYPGTMEAAPTTAPATAGNVTYPSASTPKDQLVVNGWYQLKDGRLGKWDGKNFIPGTPPKEKK